MVSKSAKQEAEPVGGTLALLAAQGVTMADYDPNRPRPAVDAAAALPGDAFGDEDSATPFVASAASAEHSAEHGADAVAAAAPVHAADTDADPATEPVHAADADADAVAAAAPEHAADTDADPAPGLASHLLPRQAEPVDRRLLAAFGGAVAVGWVIAAVVAWWLWRRWRRR